MASEFFSGRLLDRERVVWSGHPLRGIRFAGRDVVLIPFSLLWGGFAIFWETAVLSRPKAPPIMALFGIPFVAMGLFFIAGRFLLDAWLRGQTAYAITDRRILIVRAPPWGTFKAIRLDTLPEATLQEKGDGSGTIQFGAPTSVFGGNGRGFSNMVPSLDPTPQFLAIAGARQVFDLIENRKPPSIR